MLSNIDILVVFLFPYLPLYSIFKNDRSNKKALIILVDLVFLGIYLLNIFSFTIPIHKIEYDFTLPALLSIEYGINILIASFMFKKKIFLKEILLLTFPFVVDIAYKYIFANISSLSWVSFNANYLSGNFTSFYTAGYIYFTALCLLIVEVIFRLPSVKFNTYIGIMGIPLLFTLINLALESFFCTISTSYNKDTLNNAAIVITQVELLLIIVLLLVIDNSVKTIRKNKAFGNTQKDILNEYYNEYINVTLDEMIKIKHDVNNFIQVLEIDNKKIADQVKDKIKFHNSVYICKDEIINKILLVKQYTAKSKGIDFTAVCSGVDDINMSESDKISLFSNIIDNAINAAALSKDKKIDIRIIYKDQFLSVSLVNTCDDPSVKTRDRLYHGKGRIIIKQIVDQYSGKMFTSYISKKYCLQIEMDLRVEHLHI